MSSDKDDVVVSLMWQFSLNNESRKKRKNFAPLLKYAPARSVYK
jgi:hypothetical protein